MTSDDAAAPQDSVAAGRAGRLPLDTSVAHKARVYDYLLGGKDNYAVDRAATEETHGQPFERHCPHDGPRW